MKDVIVFNWQGVARVVLVHTGRWYLADEHSVPSMQQTHICSASTLGFRGDSEMQI